MSKDLPPDQLSIFDFDYSELAPSQRWYINGYGGSSRSGRRTAHRVRLNEDPTAPATALCGFRLGKLQLVDLVESRGLDACLKCAGPEGPPEPAPAKPPPGPTDPATVPFPVRGGYWLDPATDEEFDLDDVLPRGENVKDAIKAGQRMKSEKSGPIPRQEWWAETGRSRRAHRTRTEDESETLCGKRLRRPRAVNAYVGDWIACDECVIASEDSRTSI